MRVKEDVGKRARASGTSVLNKSAKERRLALGGRGESRERRKGKSFQMLPEPVRGSESDSPVKGAIKTPPLVLSLRC